MPWQLFFKRFLSQGICDCHNFSSAADCSSSLLDELGSTFSSWAISWGSIFAVLTILTTGTFFFKVIRIAHKINSNPADKKMDDRDALLPK